MKHKLNYKQDLTEAIEILENMSASKRMKSDVAVRSKSTPARRSVMINRARSNRYSLSRNSRLAMEAIARKVVNQNAETKYFDFNTDTPGTVVSLDWNGTVLETLQGLNRGDGATQRTGDKVNHKSVGIRLHVRGNNGAASGFQSVRLVVARWHNENGIAPGISTLFEQNGNSIRWLSPYNFELSKSWTILDDVRITPLASTTITTTNATGYPASYLYDKVLPTNHKITWNDDNLIVDGGIYIFILSADDPAYTWKPSFVYTLRHYFTDE